MATSCTSSPAPNRPGGAVRRVLATAGLVGALAVTGVALPATASAAEAPTGVGVARLAPAWCPFGTHGGAGGGCRGGSVNDNARLNASARATGQMYLDAGECAGRAVGSSLWRNRKRPTVGTIALGTIKPGIKCGRGKGY